MSSILVRRTIATALMCVGISACADQMASAPPASAPPPPPPSSVMTPPTPMVQAPTPARVDRSIETSAIVQKIDMKTRHVLLRDGTGRLMTVVAGPEVRNLGQVKVGDRVVLEYREALAVSMAAPGTAPVSGLATGVARAAPGDRPAAVEGSVLKARVRITAVDAARHTVTFIGPARVPRTITAREPEMQAFVAGLRAGDQVDVTYAEAIAVRVERMAK